MKENWPVISILSGKLGAEHILASSKKAPSLLCLRIFASACNAKLKRVSFSKNSHDPTCKKTKKHFVENNAVGWLFCYKFQISVEKTDVMDVFTDSGLSKSKMFPCHFGTSWLPLLQQIQLTLLMFGT